MPATEAPAPVPAAKLTEFDRVASKGMTRSQFRKLMARMQQDVLSTQICAHRQHAAPRIRARSLCLPPRAPFPFARQHIAVYTAPDGTLALRDFGLLVVAISNLLPDGAAQLRTLPPALAKVCRRIAHCASATPCTLPSERGWRPAPCVCVRASRSASRSGTHAPSW